MRTVQTVSSIYRIAIAASLISAATVYNEAAVAASSPSTVVTAQSGALISKRAYVVPLRESVQNAKSFDEFAAAIHLVETAGREGRIYGDGGRSYGPLQISYATWRDAIHYAPSIGGRYADCRDFAYSKKIMLAYLGAHDAASLKNSNWEVCARLWNAGPGWKQKKHLTNAYWADVRGCLMAKLG
jgi:hypothetical protein